MPVIFGFVLAYIAFVVVGYLLARLIFPSLESDEREKTKRSRVREL